MDIEKSQSTTAVQLEHSSPLPIGCVYVASKRLFRVTKEKGSTLASGGYGILIQENSERAVSTQNEGSQCTDESLTTTASCDSQLKTTPNPTSYLFIEEVLVLFELGLIQVSNDDDDTNSPLQSLQLYNLLAPCGVDLSVYLVYAHLRGQTFRVVRNTPKRLLLLQDRLALRMDAAAAAPPRVGTIGFDAYLPNSKFAKARPGVPDFHVAVMPRQVTFANLQQLFYTASDVDDTSICNSSNIPLKVATVSDSGTVILFGIERQGVPVLTTSNTNITEEGEVANDAS
jgi:hypothetical protein